MSVRKPAKKTVAKGKSRAVLASELRQAETKLQVLQDESLQLKSLFAGETAAREGWAQRCKEKEEELTATEEELREAMQTVEAATAKLKNIDEKLAVLNRQRQEAERMLRLHEEWKDLLDRIVTLAGAESTVIRPPKPESTPDN